MDAQSSGSPKSSKMSEIRIQNPHNILINSTETPFVQNYEEKSQDWREKFKHFKNNVKTMQNYEKKNKKKRKFHFVPDKIPNISITNTYDKIYNHYSSC